MLSIGDKGASWVVPVSTLKKGAVCYLFGAGENISFDIAIAVDYKVEVYSFDPTPRAIKYVETELSKLQARDSSEMKLEFYPYGVWDESKTMKFYAPRNEEHISHSLVNLQKTDHYFEAQVKTLNDIMLEMGHTRIDLLKLDIEGAEYAVLNDILKKHVEIEVICVEFDELFNPLDEKYLERIREMILKIEKSGYRLVNVDQSSNYTFIRSGE
jgi:FkbM family methyltransferase